MKKGIRELFLYLIVVVTGDVPFSCFVSKRIERRTPLTRDIRCRLPRIFGIPILCVSYLFTQSLSL